MTGEPRRPDGGGHGGKEDRRPAAISRYGGVGLQFALSLILFLYAGQWIDRKLGSDPWGVLIGVFAGGAAAFYAMYHRLMKDLERDERDRRK